MRKSTREITDLADITGQDLLVDYRVVVRCAESHLHQDDPHACNVLSPVQLEDWYASERSGELRIHCVGCHGTSVYREGRKAEYEAASLSPRYT
jgi:hypothetical protein